MSRVATVLIIQCVLLLCSSKAAIGQEPSLYSTTEDSLLYSAWHDSIRNLLIEGAYEEALASSQSLLESSKAKNDLLQFNSASWVLFCHLRLKNCEEGSMVGQKAVDQLSSSQYGDLVLMSQIMNNLASLYSNCNLFDQAIEIFEQALRLDSLNDRQQSDLHFRIYNNLGLAYRRKGDYQKAVAIAKIALRGLKENFGEAHELYSSRLNVLALQYKRMGIIDSALHYYQLSIENSLKYYSPLNEDLAITYSNLSSLYLELDEFEKAREIITKSLDIEDKLHGKNTPTYFLRLGKLAGIESMMGNIPDALELRHQIYDFQLREQPNSRYHAYTASNLASNYEDLGQYKIALNYSQIAVDILTGIFGDTHVELALQISKMAAIESSMGLLDSSLNHYKQAIKIEESVRGKNHQRYGELNYNIAAIYYEKKNLSKALDYGVRAVQHLEEKLGVNHVSYATALNNLGLIYIELDSMHRGLKCVRKASKIALENLGPYHQTSLRYSNNLASICDKLSLENEAEKIFTNLINRLLYQIDWYFPSLSEHGRMSYWNFASGISDRIFQFVLERDKQQMLPLIFDLHRKTQNLALNYNNQTRDLIALSDDQQIDSLFKVLEIKRTKLYNTLNADNPSLEPVRIQSEISMLDTRIAHLLDIHPPSDLTIKDIRNKLSSSDLILDFFTCDISVEPMNSRSYYAFAIDQDQIQIHFIGTDSIIESMISRVRGKNLTGEKLAEIYQQYFGKLADKSVRQIFINATGSLHQFPFEAGSTLLGKHTCRIISSYDHLDEEFTKLASVSLFGDPDFDYRTSENHMDTSLRKSIAFHERGINDVTRDALYFGSLPGSREEVHAIANQVKKAKWDVELYLEQEASEKELYNFKSDVLHLATHGFFFKRREESDFNPSRFRERLILSQNPLFRSGLVLAGANDSWLTSKTNKYQEDGIVTAFEIAQLRLDACKLVVLSACETGLGDIDDREGVLGLSRAFKLAGVSQLIVSLWKIPDKETMEFMETFYKFLSKGKSVEKAFTQTQKKISRRYDPYYWAGFTLIQ